VYDGPREPARTPAAPTQVEQENIVTRRHLTRRAPIAMTFVAGLALGVLFSLTPTGQHAVAAEKDAPDLAGLRAEVERLKGLVPDQSHAMSDVGYHYANLWFAGEQGNWPLADFFFGEVRSHLNWAVRIIPVRKDLQGRDVDLRAILQAIDTSSLKDLQQTIAAKDKTKFEAAYRVQLQSCYSCHEASGKPYLRPQVPQRPPLDLIDFRTDQPAPAK
jgi:hypothetical protein